MDRSVDSRGGRLCSFLLGFAFVCVALAPIAVDSARYFWCGASGGDFSNSLNWDDYDAPSGCSGAGPPSTSADDVLIQSGTPGVFVDVHIDMYTTLRSINITANCILRLTALNTFALAGNLYLLGNASLIVEDELNVVALTAATDIIAIGANNQIVTPMLTTSGSVVLFGYGAELSVQLVLAAPGPEPQFIWSRVYEAGATAASIAAGASRTLLSVTGVSHTRVSVSILDLTLNSLFLKYCDFQSQSGLIRMYNLTSCESHFGAHENVTVSGTYVVLAKNAGVDSDFEIATTASFGAVARFNHIELDQNSDGLMYVPRSATQIVDGVIYLRPGANSGKISFGGDSTLPAVGPPSLFITHDIRPDVILGLANGGDVQWHIAKPVCPALIDIAVSPGYTFYFSGNHLNASGIDIGYNGPTVASAQADLDVVVSNGGMLGVSQSGVVRLLGTGKLDCGAGIQYLSAGFTLDVYVQSGSRGVWLGVVFAAGANIRVFSNSTTPTATTDVVVHADELTIGSFQFSGNVPFNWLYPFDFAVAVDREIVVHRNTSVRVDYEVHIFDSYLPFNVSGRLEFEGTQWNVNGRFHTPEAVPDNEAWLVISLGAIMYCHSNTLLTGNLNLFLRHAHLFGPCNDGTLANTGQILGGYYTHLKVNGYMHLPRFAPATDSNGVQITVLITDPGELVIDTLTVDYRDVVTRGVSLGAYFQIAVPDTSIYIGNLRRLQGPNVTFVFDQPRCSIEFASNTNQSSITDVEFHLQDDTSVILGAGVVFNSSVLIKAMNGVGGTLQLAGTGAGMLGAVSPSLTVIITANATVIPFPALNVLRIHANSYLTVTGADFTKSSVNTLEMYGRSGIIASTSAISRGDYQIDVRALWKVGLNVPNLATAIVYDHVFINSSAVWLIDSAPVTARILFTGNAAFAASGGVKSQCSYCPVPTNAALSQVLITVDSAEYNTLDRTFASHPSGFDFRNTTLGNATFTFQCCVRMGTGVVVPTASVIVNQPSGGSVCVPPVSQCAALTPCSPVGTISPPGCIDWPHPNQFLCPCASGYAPPTCGGVPPDPCLSTPCNGHGVCTPGPLNLTFSCACTPPWGGSLCTVPSNPCDSNPCGAHSSGCVPQNNNSTFQCTCNQYWSGAQCTVWTNPCVPVSPCLFSTDCVTQTNSSTYTCVCNSPECGAGNPDERQRIEKVVPALVSLTPGTSSPIGGQLMTLTTRGFTASSVKIQFGTLPATAVNGTFNAQSESRVKLAAGTVLSAPVPFNLSVDADAPTYLRQLKFRFVTPPYAITASSYRLLVVTAVLDDGSTTVLTLESSSLLYYPFNPCLDAGIILQFDSSGVPYCAPCPEGGFCPGGGRVWPIDRYWSRSEFSTPTACAVGDACPGSMGEREDYPVQTNSDGSRVTTQCAVEYAGDFCGACAENYYRSGSRCFSCGAATDSDQAELRFLIAAAVIIFVLLAIAVAALSSRYLAWIVSGLIALQQFVTIGKSSIQTLPASFNWLVQLIGFLSVINFDVEMVKPGCIVPALPFLSLYWTTLILVVAFAALFVVGAAVRATWVYYFRLKPLLAARARGDGGAGGKSVVSHHKTASVSAGAPDAGLTRRQTTKLTVVLPKSPTGNGVGAGAGGDAMTLDSKLELTVPRTAPAAGLSAGVSGGVATPRAVAPLLSSPAGNNNGSTDSPLRTAATITVDSTPTKVGAPSDSPLVDTNGAAPAAASSDIPAIRNTTDERDWATSWWDVFSARAIQSLLILSSLVFLKILTLALNCVHCETYSGTESDETQTADSTRLVVDLQTVCYSGAHRRAAIFDFFLIFCFGGGFPLLSSALLWRAFRPLAKIIPDAGFDDSSDAMDAAARFSARRNDRYGYLYRGLVPAVFYFRLLTFVTNWGFAIQSVFTQSTAIQLFVPGLFFLLNSTGTALLWPYSAQHNNLISLIVGFGGVLQVMVYLGLLGRAEGGSSTTTVWQFLYYIAVLTFISGVFIIYWRRRQSNIPAAATAASAATGAATVGASIGVLIRAAVVDCCGAR